MKPLHIPVFAALGLLALGIQSINAQSLMLSWDMVNANAALTNPMSSTTTNAPLLATSGYVSYGSGVTASNVSPAFRVVGFNQTNLAGSLTDNDYLLINFTPLQSLNIQQLTFVVKTATSAAFNYNLFSSATGWDEANSLFSNNNGTNTLLQTNTISLTSYSALQNISTNVEFRIYGYRPGGGNGNFEFANGGSPIDVGIYAEAIPEPSMVALLSLGFGTLAFAGFRKSAARRRKN